MKWKKQQHLALFRALFLYALRMGPLSHIHEQFNFGWKSDIVCVFFFVEISSHFIKWCMTQFVIILQNFRRYAFIVRNYSAPRQWAFQHDLVETDRNADSINAYCVTQRANWFAFAFTLTLCIANVSKCWWLKVLIANIPMHSLWIST